MTPCWDNLKIIAAWALVPILRLDENSTMGFDNGTAESVRASFDVGIDNECDNPTSKTDIVQRR